MTQTSRDQSNGNHSRTADSNSDSHLMDEETMLVCSDMCEQQNIHILRNLRAFCTDQKNFFRNFFQRSVLRLMAQ
jgi:hypothetical protein